MKLTKSRLKRIIKEEVQKVLLKEFFEPDAKFYKSSRYPVIVCQNKGNGPCYVQEDGGWTKIGLTPATTGPPWKEIPNPFKK
jgi:hypothetical protein